MAGDDGPARDRAGDPRGEQAGERRERRHGGADGAAHPRVAVPLELATPEHDGPIRLLHVEDSAEIGALSRRLLARVDGDFAVESVTSVADALDRLREGDVDCVLSDYAMPRTDGLAFLAAVRERHPTLPFVLFTAQGDAGVASEAIAAGATDYMRKRLDHDTYADLAERVTAAVRGHDTRRALWRERSWFRGAPGPRVLGIFVVQDGRLVAVTEHLADRLGRERAALLGDSPLAMVADGDREDLDFLVDRAAETAETLELALTATTAAGEQIPVAIRCGAVSYEGNPAVLGVVRALDGD